MIFDNNKIYTNKPSNWKDNVSAAIAALMPITLTIVLFNSLGLGGAFVPIIALVFFTYLALVIKKQLNKRGWNVTNKKLVLFGLLSWPAVMLISLIGILITT